MMYIVGTLISILLFIIIVQIGNVNELAAKLRGERQAYLDGNDWNARMMLFFLGIFLIGTVWSAIYYAPYMLGYGPNVLATEHAPEIMSLFNTTLFFTGVVFVITHILLFLFAYQYREKEGAKAKFIPHDNRLEKIWTIIPAVVMAILVVFGLMAWNNTMADVNPDAEPIGLIDESAENTYLEIGATGMQFAWILRHPGKDGLLGEKNYKLITGTNQLGQDFEDPKNIDDLIIDKLVLPKGQTVRVRISSRDVLHNFDIPHFFVKMDAVPGMPTYFKFTPTMTTEEYRKHLSQYEEWQVPDDPAEPDGLKRWETFDFELACAELCGKSHYSMRRVVKVVEPSEYNEWLEANEHSSLYLSEIRGTEADPFIDEPLLAIEKRLLEKAEKAKPDTAPQPTPSPGTVPGVEPVTPQPLNGGNTGGTTGSIDNGSTSSTSTSTTSTTVNTASGTNVINEVKTTVENAKSGTNTIINDVKNAASDAADKAVEGGNNLIDKVEDKAKDVGIKKPNNFK